ncbi:HAMP domain-containing sensor histidine kinase [Sphaerisporangium perillae]|uniref:HAMP domain-containing sensor histidine kinase n=1 Tax=Sphaerisporangium perillae TaxID=2935860 RepID=UPI0020100601|nr:ATP-binding protein [Sphaerisporangium perillae]
MSYVVISAMSALVAGGIAGFIVPSVMNTKVTVQTSNGCTRQDRAGLLGAGQAAGLSLLADDLTRQQDGRSRPEILAAVARRWLAASPSAAGPSAESKVVRAVAGLDGRLVQASEPFVYGAGSTPPGLSPGTQARTGAITLSGKEVGWAINPVVAGGKVIGVVYLEDRSATDCGPVVDVASNGDNRAGPVSAGLALVVLVPVCLVFGLLSTRKLIKRIQRLAAGAATMADGDLTSRVPVSAGDEIGRLEEGFNVMAERLVAAGRVERELAGAQARRLERTRIARELHDSVSQDLFSLSLVARSLRRTLPESSRFQEQAESMVKTVEHTMREMRAMLLQLRPIALEEAGLVATLRDLCEAFQVRLGVTVDTELQEVRLGPGAEHAVLRIVQEALSNATRHGGAQRIELRLSQEGEDVEIVVRDYGRGFDMERNQDRHGMGLEMMRERVIEVGGVIEVVSAPASGTTVRVRIPAEEA